MEQRVLGNKRSASADVGLTLAGTQMPDFGLHPGHREASRGAEMQAAAVVGPEHQVQPPVFYFVLKRTLDIVISVLALVVGFLPMMLLALCIRLESAGSPLHRRRVLAWQTWDESQGEGALLTFDAYKMRTMVSDADDYLQRNPHLMEAFQKDWKLENDPRITRFGAWLRSTSIDEFPQLLNVLKGQMTLVGPRMITTPELSRYGRHGSRLLSVKPGLTGLWQVSGRQELSYEERVRLDMTYIDSRSLRLDVRILLKTVICVLQRKGAY